MIMKIPSGGSGNGYYGHESHVISYPPENNDASTANQSNGQAVDSPTLDGDFSEYMWMENEEEFDKQVMQQLEEEALMEQCIEAMLEDEREVRNSRNQGPANGAAAPETRPQWSNVVDFPQQSASSTSDLCQTMENMRVRDDLAKESTLNPNAAEFVPIPRLAPAPVPS